MYSNQKSYLDCHYWTENLAFRKWTFKIILFFHVFPQIALAIVVLTSSIGVSGRIIFGFVVGGVIQGVVQSVVRCVVGGVWGWVVAEMLDSLCGGKNCRKGCNKLPSSFPLFQHITNFHGPLIRFYTLSHIHLNHFTFHTSNNFHLTSFIYRHNTSHIRTCITSSIYTSPYLTDFYINSTLPPYSFSKYCSDGAPIRASELQDFEDSFFCGVCCEKALPKLFPLTRAFKCQRRGGPSHSSRQCFSENSGCLFLCGLVMCLCVRQVLRQLTNSKSFKTSAAFAQDRKGFLNWSWYLRSHVDQSD